MYRIYTSALAWLLDQPAITISEDVDDATEMSMRLAERFAAEGKETVLMRDTGNPDLPSEAIHYNRQARN